MIERLTDQLCRICALLVMFPGLLTGQVAENDSLQPIGWDVEIRLPEAPDLNPDPTVVEIEMEARVATVEIAPGLTVKAWTYNGLLPGPLVRVNVGDRFIVHFTNNLPTSTTIHWHGLRIPIEMDGVPGYSQPPVESGGTFTYDFVVPDAGIYWYHPHVMSAAQVGFGLYGAFLVEDPDENVGVSDDLVVLLSDIGLDDEGVLESPDSGGSTGMAFGREGNHVLVNGKKTPLLTARSGAPQRWRVINAAKSRYFKLDMGEGHRFIKIGGDGGLLEYSVEQDFIVLGAGERADVIVVPKAEPGTHLIVKSQLHNRGYGSIELRNNEDLIDITMSDSPVYESPPLPELRRQIEPFHAEGATQIRLELTLGQDLYDKKFEYGINGIPFWEAKPVMAKLGETQLWTVENTTPWSHPLHLHGFFFLVLDENGQPVRPLEWKDTVDIPFKETRQLLVQFDDDRPGTWIFHCHILDHADGGLLNAVQLGLPEGMFKPMSSH